MRDGCRVVYCPLVKAKCYEGSLDVGYNYSMDEVEFVKCVFWGSLEVTAKGDPVESCRLVTVLDSLYESY